MTRKTGWGKFGSKGVVLLLSLLLLIGLTGGAFAQTEQPLENYATSIKAELTANAQGEDLPQYVENGQSLFFGLQISNFKSQELVTYLKANPEADFTIPLDFTGHIAGNYPAQINPDDFDNVAYVGGVPLFRWWIDEDSGVIRVRFDENWIKNAGNNTVVENVKLGFDGILNVADKSNDGKVVFNAAGSSFPLQMKTGYTLNKTAGVPYYSIDSSSYVTDYTVTLTLDQNMMLSGTGDMYIAALTLVDTVENGGALQGTIVGDVTVTAPEGETAAAAVSNNGTANTLTLSSPDQKLVKGTYTFTYKMAIESKAAAAKLEGYTESQKTNTVELKENAASLKTPLTADATIAWDDVTENQFKIDKNAFTEKAPNYKGVYWDKDTDKYYIDFRVVVYIREPVSTFTVTDHSNYSLTFRDVPTSPMLEGVDTSANYWNNDINTATLTNASAMVTSELNDASEMVITVTAPEGQMLAPGAYHLRVPADVTGAVETTLKNSYPQSYSNTAYLTSVDGQPTTENKEFKQAIPNRTEPRKDGGYAVNDTTGELLYYNGKPVIRWDVWLGWDFYNKTSFEDTLSGMEMLINANYPFEIHSFTDQNHHKERLASMTSLNDTDYLDFNENGTGFTFTNEKLYTNADGTPVKMYKLVYFTTPLDADNELGYVNMDLENGYSITHTTQSGDGFGTGPITGDVEPNMTSQGRLYVKKKHVIERTDSLTQWLITCDNTTNKIPFAWFNDLDIIDLVPQGQTPIGEVTIHYSDTWPIEVEMVCSNNQRVTLTEGTHYSIVKKLEGYDFGDNGEYGFAVDLDMDAVAAVLASQDSAYFKTIEVKCYLNNETHPSGQNYRIKNDGWLDYTNQGVELVDGVNAYYDRGFATKSKGVVEYGDNYDPNAPRRYYVCNPDGSSSQQSFTGGYDDDPTTGDGQDEIVWRIYLGAREFGNDDEPIQVTVTDTFSDNQMFPTYEGKSVKDLFIIRAEKNQDYVILPDSVSVNGNSFTLTFTVPAKGWVEGDKDKSKNLYIYYHTILKPEAMQEALDAASKDASTIKIDYTNTATVGWNGESYTLPTSSGSMTMNGAMLDKTAKFMQSSGSKVSYTIEMNPYGLDMADGDVILLEDSMGDGKDVFSYIPSSFKLINQDTGAQMSPSTAASSTTYVLKMAEDGKSFTLDVPDNTHLKLTYQVKTTQPVGTQDVTLVNNASLAGRKPQAETITFDVSSAYQSGSFSVLPDEAGIRLVKISSEGADSDAPTFLSGAEFTVTQLDSSFQQVGTVQTMTTDAKGFIEIKETLTDVLYVVVEETKAPEGYRLGSEPWKWCYALVPAGNSLSDADVAKLKETVHCDVTVISAGSYVEDSIINEPVTLTVRKVDENGDLLEGAQFTLRMGDTEIEPDKTHTVAGELRFKNLKAGDYTLAETQAPTGYAVPAECPWNFTLDANGSVAFDKAYGYLALSNDGLYLRVINTPETSAITVKKVWNDNADQDGKRNGVVANVILSKTVDGVTTDIESIKVDPEDDWSYEWFNLPVYEDNKPITYSIREELVEANGYTSDTTEAKEVIKNGVVTITNTHVPEMTSVTVKKNWDDEENQDGKRPEALTVTLSDGTEVELNEGNSWTATVENLPKYADGEEIVYTWTEEKLPEGYTLTKTNVNGTITTLTNSYEPETITVEGSKTWDDKDDQDGLRPDSITINLLADGVEVAESSVNEADGWKWSFTDLPKYKDQGTEIVYTITEDTVDGYKSEVKGFDVTNSYDPETITVEGSKTWDDKDDQDGLRPDSITINLLADGVEVAESSVTEADGWAWLFVDLPKYKDQGTEIVYTITEDTVDGYKSEVNGFDVTNSYDPETISVEGSKTWDDKDDQDGLRPDSITINLLADGVEVAESSVTEADGWKWSFTDLPKYKDQGTEIVYTITEDTVDGYKAEVNGFDVTNSYDPETITVEGSKTWDDNNDQDGLRPDSITINLLADGEEIETITVTEADGWKWSFTDLPKYRDQGTEIVYTITEDTVDGYKSEVNGFDVTNSYDPETITVEGSKTWDDKDDQDGLRPDSITVNLLADGEVIETITVTEADGWKWSFTDLPKYKDQGAEIVYTITEDTVDGYKSEVNGFDVTNSYDPETIEVSGSKTWDDNNDQDGLRPNSITINLLADGEVIETITVTEGDGWKWSFTDLPKYKDQGTEIVYTITEDTVDGYKSEVNGFDVTNSYDPETITVEGSKTWDDKDDQDGLRPNSITINLLADGEVIETITVTEADGWAWLFVDLPKYKDQGTEIVYTITEDTVDGYKSEVNGFDVTNSYEPETITVEGSKTWDDKDDQDGLRPNSITINLLADGEVIETITVTEAVGWKWSFTDLPKYKDQGTEIVYSITEDAVDGYKSEVKGFDVTNSYDPETISVEGSKTWDDKDDQDGLRPDSITINLLADGEVIETITVTEADGWKWSFTDLPKYKDQGTEIVYTITEDTVDGYKSEVKGFDVTNSYDPETITVEGSKTWDDNNDQDGVRPDSITINLLADGEVIETITVTEADGWKWGFTDLPKYKDQGTEIVYTITEDAVDGYETKVDGFDVTNTHEPETVEVTVTKIWNDRGNQGNSRPDHLTVVLLADGEETTMTATLNEANGWTETLGGLPKRMDGEEIAYSWDEVTVPAGYTIANRVTEGNETTITNDYAAEGSVQFKGSKTLIGTDLAAEQFSFTLTGDGVNETVKNDANGKFSFSEIKYDLDDVGEHTYTVIEVNDGKPGYEYDDTEYEIIVTVADAGDGTLTVTYTVNGNDNSEIVFGNEYESAGSIRIQGQKLVQGEAPEADETFTFQLKDADGHVLQEVENQGSLIAFEEISYTLADDGKTYVYTIAESTESDASWQTDDSEYTLTVTLTDDGAGNMETAWTLEKNGEGAETILFNNIPLNSLTVEKTVVGGDAEKVFAFKVTLTDADGKELNGTYPVNGADVSSIASGEYLHLKNGEKAEITCLPVGTKYTVEEDEYIAYTPTVNGAEGRKAEGTITEDGAAVTFVNTEKTVSFSVTKEWQGDIGDAITLTLYGNGEKLNPQPSYNKNGDVYSYENLPQYDADGKTIVYSAKEKYQDGFMTIYRNKAPYTEETGWIYNGGTIVNRAVTEFRVQKVWEGLEEGEEIPEITLTLYCNGEAMDKKTPKPDEDGWYVWYNLPIMKDGETAQYSVMEEPVDGFTVTYGEDDEATCAYNGDTIVNRKIPKTGDDSRIGLWLAITAVSAAGCILLMKKRKEAQ